MTEAEVLQKLGTYKDAIINLKKERDEYKEKCETLKLAAESVTELERFKVHIENAIVEIDSILNS